MRSFVVTSLLLIAVASMCVLVSAQQSPSSAPAQRSQASSASGDWQKSAWQMLDAGVTDKGKDRRVRALSALAMVGNDPKAIQEAEAALDDKEPVVRAAAARALGEMHSTASIPKLTAAAQDKDLLVAVSASSALLALKEKAGYDVFYEVLTGERKGEGMIAQQAKDFKDPKKASQFAFEEGIGFVPFAGGGFEAIRMLTKKDPSPVRAAAAAALADDPDPNCGQALASALKDDNWIVRIAVVKAIVKRGDPALLPVVAGAMSDKRDEVRLSAAAAVLRLSAAPPAEKKAAKVEMPR